MNGTFNNNRQGNDRPPQRRQGSTNMPPQSGRTGGGVQQVNVEATSPYNFVPLSSKVFFPDWAEQVSHDLPFRDGICGELVCELVTDTPVFVRNGGHWKSRDELMKDKNAWESFFCGVTDDGKKQFMIPGTTLKGMLRNVVEIASFGKFSRVDNHRYSVRDLNNRDKSLYMDWMTRTVAHRVYETKISAGWLAAGDDEEGVWALYPCKMSRVEHNELIQWHGRQPDIKKKQTAPEKYGKWGEKSLHVLFDPGQVTDHDKHSCGTLIYSKAENLGRGETEGVIVFTGQPGDNKRHQDPKNRSKHFEFIFHGPSGTAITVPDEIKQDFIFNHTNANGTANEEWGYWKGKLKKSKIPVFYRLTDDGKELHSIGLAMMYRLPYEYSTRDAVGHTSQEHLDDSRLDLAEVIFGRVPDSKSKSSPMEALKGRVSISTALADLTTCRSWKDETTDEKCSPKKDEPYIQTVLGCPKPTFYPNYLEQPARIDPSKGHHYNTYMNDDCRLRGWKRYPVRKSETVTRGTMPQGVPNDDVDTRMIPLAPKAKFTFRIKLHNLLPEEAGALIWALTWGDRPHLRHSFGMGKPFGFGQAAITINNDVSLLVDMNGNQVSATKTLDAYNRLMQDFAGRDWERTPQLEQLFAMADPSVAPAPEKLKYPVLTVKPNRNDFAQIKIQGRMLASYVPTGSYLSKIRKTVISSDSTTSPSPAKPVEADVWQCVTLFYNPGNRTITAQYQGMTATLPLTPDTEKLFPDEIIESIKGKKKEATATIKVQQVGGKQFRITSIE